MSKNRKADSYAGWPYGKLMEAISSKNTAGQEFGTIIEHVLRAYPEMSLLQVADRYAESLRSEHSDCFVGSGYRGIARLAERLGYKLIGSPDNKYTFEIDRPFFGCSIGARKRKRIVIGSNLTVSQARATICHEISHSLFDCSNGLRPGDLQSNEIEEFVCEYIAAQLLAPHDTISKLMASFEEESFSSSIVTCAKKLGVPRRLLAMRLYDPKLSEIGGNLAGVIEWRQKSDTESGNQSREIVVTWSVCKDAFVPWEGGKKTCHARENSLVSEIMNSDSTYSAGSKIENTSIGSLRGRFDISACVIGGKDSPWRRVFSVFREVS